MIQKQPEQSSEQDVVFFADEEPSAQDYEQLASQMAQISGAEEQASLEVEEVFEEEAEEEPHYVVCDEASELNQEHTEEVVTYVFVDELGNEILIDESDLDQYEIVEEDIACDASEVLTDASILDETEEIKQDTLYVFVDDQGNEIEIPAEELDQYEVIEEVEIDTPRTHNKTYDKVQETTNGLNEIAREGVSTARELKETYEDIRGMFNFKSWLK